MDCHVSLFKLTIKTTAKRLTLLLNNLNATLRKCSSRAFIWVITPQWNKMSPAVNALGNFSISDEQITDIFMANCNNGTGWRHLHFTCELTSNKPVSQSCAVAESKTFCRDTGQSNLVDRWLSARKLIFQSLVFVFTQLHFGQWNSLPFCLASLIIKWPASSCHFQLLRMILNWFIAHYLKYSKMITIKYNIFRTDFGS